MTPIPWIFQFNPKNFDWETGLKPGTINTWSARQLGSLMEHGQTVYIWRAAAKTKMTPGIIATATIQSKPELQRQFTQSPRGQKIFESTKPDYCAVLKIETFHDDRNMLRKETAKTDSVLKSLKILTTWRQTNYQIENNQAKRIDELLKSERQAGHPTYKDFGEAPDDDPSELRMFAGKVRRGQLQFRKTLFRLYGSKCAITGTEVVETLDACHVWDHAVGGINHSENGILLRADIHNLFDEGLIVIDPSTMTVVVDTRLRKSEYGKYHGIQLQVRSDGSQISKKYLTKRG